MNIFSKLLKNHDRDINLIQGYIKQKEEIINIYKELFKQDLKTKEEYMEVIRNIIPKISKLKNKDEEIIMDIERNIFIFIESKEYDYYGDSIYPKERLQDVFKVLKETNYTSNKKFLSKYVDVLCYNYMSLNQIQRIEAEDFYRFKCDIIDNFEVMMGD